MFSEMAQTSHENSSGCMEILDTLLLTLHHSFLPPLVLSRSICCVPLLFLSIVRTKHPIQAPMTSVTAGSGRLNGQWPRRDKGQFIGSESNTRTGRTQKHERDRERERVERVALGAALWLDSHLVTMCDQSSRANDGLPEASSIRPGLTGLPERSRKRDDYRHAASLFLCACVYESLSTLVKTQCLQRCQI